MITNYKDEPGVEFSYFASGQSGEGGDPYVGLDSRLAGRRVIDQRRVKGFNDLERLMYGATCPVLAGNRASNRIWRENTVANGGRDEFYSYDGLYQVTELARGTLNANKTGIDGTPAWEENWNFDPTGNWHGENTGYPMCFKSSQKFGWQGLLKTREGSVLEYVIKRGAKRNAATPGLWRLGFRQSSADLRTKKANESTLAEPG